MDDNFMKLKKWTELYQHGTKEGEEEQKLFIALSRHPKWQWRSVSALAKESGLSKIRVEEILYKYWKMKIVYQNASQSEQWAYWERIPNIVQKTQDQSLVDIDKKSRLVH